MPRCLPSIICQKNCSTIFHLQYAAANGCQVLFLYPSFAKCKSMFFDHWDVNFLCISALNFLFFLPLCHSFANATANIPYTGMPLSTILFPSLQSAAANLSCAGFLVYLPFVYHLQNGATMNITATVLPVNHSTSPSFQ